MSLDWDVSRVPDYERVCFVGEGDDRRAAPVTEILALSTILVGLGAITEKNAAEFYARVKLLEQLDGPFLRKDDKDVYITPDDVRAHIGLYSNVVSETRAQWYKRFIGQSLDQTAREYRRHDRRRVAA